MFLFFLSLALQTNVFMESSPVECRFVLRSLCNLRSCRVIWAGLIYTCPLHLTLSRVLFQEVKNKCFSDMLLNTYHHIDEWWLAVHGGFSATHISLQVSFVQHWYSPDFVNPYIILNKEKKWSLRVPFKKKWLYFIYFQAAKPCFCFNPIFYWTLYGIGLRKTTTVLTNVHLRFCFKF